MITTTEYPLILVGSCMNDTFIVFKKKLNNFNRGFLLKLWRKMSDSNHRKMWVKRYSLESDMLFYNGILTYFLREKYSETSITT